MYYENTLINILFVKGLLKIIITNKSFLFAKETFKYFN